MAFKTWFNMQEQNVNCTRESRRFLLGVTEIVQTCSCTSRGWIMSPMIKPAQECVLQAQYRTEQCQQDTAAGALSPTCCQIECPSLGGGLEGREPVEHRAHHWDLSQQPLQSTTQNWWEEPPGGWVTPGYHRAGFVASPLPAVVLHLLSEAEVVLPVSLF